MTMPDSGRQAALRAVIAGFLAERLDGKLEKLAPDDPQHHQLRRQFDPSNWLADAARRDRKAHV